LNVFCDRRNLLCWKVAAAAKEVSVGKSAMPASVSTAHALGSSANSIISMLMLRLGLYSVTVIHPGAGEREVVV